MTTVKQITTISRIFFGNPNIGFETNVLFQAPRASRITKWKLSLEIFVDPLEADLQDTYAAWGVQRLRNGLEYSDFSLGDIQTFNFSNNEDSWPNPYEILGYGIFGIPVFTHVIDVIVYTPQQHVLSKSWEDAAANMELKIGDRLIFTLSTDGNIVGAVAAEAFGIFEFEYVY